MNIVQHDPEASFKWMIFVNNVAPLVNGQPVSDGVMNLVDLVVIQRKVLGEYYILKSYNRVLMAFYFSSKYLIYNKLG
ncbi:MAG: hypothetical protein BMS9Abin19_0240 [Gammaproteobacteria bacterium]|nr:MAG: hypothetical protein BMS9Abin19_0240 [Gammaproteobacteria bacterium]